MQGDTLRARVSELEAEKKALVMDIDELRYSNLNMPLIFFLLFN